MLPIVVIKKENEDVAEMSWLAPDNGGSPIT
jgi:hypothetical protein